MYNANIKSYKVTVTWWIGDDIWANMRISIPCAKNASKFFLGSFCWECFFLPFLRLEHWVQQLRQFWILPHLGQHPSHWDDIQVIGTKGRISSSISCKLAKSWGKICHFLKLPQSQAITHKKKHTITNHRNPPKTKRLKNMILGKIERSFFFHFLGVIGHQKYNESHIIKKETQIATLDRFSRVFLSPAVYWTEFQHWNHSL